MKRFLLTSFILCFAIVFKNNAQEWVKINTSLDSTGSHNLSYGTFINEQDGWFAEFFPGRIWVTQDGGYNWELQNEKTGVWFHALEFVDTLHGWVIGETISDRKHFLLTTTDGGLLWEEKEIPKIYNLTFLDSSTGFAGGDSIYLTLNGGESWQPGIIQPETRFGITDIYFLDRENGWAVGGSSEIYDAGIILKTTTGGEIWQVNNHPASVYGYAVYFTDSISGYVVGSNPPFFEGVIMLTKDGCETWQIQYLPCTWLNDVFFVNDSAGWIVGDSGFIWYTEDAGETWQRINSDTHADLNRIVFVDSGRVGYIFGDDNTLLKIEREINSINDDHSFSPSIFKLFQNYPNPFNSQTVITYELNKTIFVQLKVYDLTGKEVVTLINGKQTAGSYHLSWNGKNKNGKEVSSGIYLYQLRTKNFNQSKKMILIR